MADYVVEYWSEGTDWYRLYKSGWCEQGGSWTGTSSYSTHVVTLLMPYKDTIYHVTQTTECSNDYLTSSNSDSIRGAAQKAGSILSNSKEPTQFTTQTYYTSTWKTEGYA